MYCANPFVQAGRVFGCGQCMPCRINRRRIWTHRILLEAKEHKHNAFVTLTYSTENLPLDMSVDSITLQKWLKRLRRLYEPNTFRFYAVGEYGEENRRPHYHAALFGFPTCHKGRTFVNRISSVCCPVCTLVQRSWQNPETKQPYGYAYVGQLQPESAAYIAGYVTKKFLQIPDTMGLRAPFARMSTRPGIGAGAMDDLASALLLSDYKQPDVPTALHQGSTVFPLGRYLRKRLRKRIGRDEATPQSTLRAMDEQMSELRQTAFENSRSLKEVVIEAGEPKRLKQKFWQSIRDQRKRSGL